MVRGRVEEGLLVVVVVAVVADAPARLGGGGGGPLRTALLVRLFREVDCLGGEASSFLKKSSEELMPATTSQNQESK